MNKRRDWTREELILAINLYCRTPFGKIHNRNPEIIKLAKDISRSPSAVSYKLANFASIDPTLSRKGASNYSKRDLEVWEEFFNDWESLAYESEILRLKYEKTNIVEEIKDKLPEAREKISAVKVRTTQSFFRKTILATYNYQCCITGISVAELLVASHIVPWSRDEKNRMNPSNGLCLNALHDKAFDVGLITISDKYRVIISKYLEKKCILGVECSYFKKFQDQKITLPKRFLPSKDLIKYHREKIFIKE